MSTRCFDMLECVYFLVKVPHPTGGNDEYLYRCENSRMLNRWPAAEMA